MFDAAHITVTGKLAEYTNRSDAGNTIRPFRARWRKLFGKNTGMPGFMTIAAGTFDEPDWLEPAVTVFASRCHWDFMDPAVATYDAQPPGNRRVNVSRTG
jgi:hypothetical protein